MARYTSAYSSFVFSLGEVEILRRSASRKETTDAVKLRHEINALCRGAVVLLCGHLEAFIKELGEVALESIHGKNVPRTTIATRLYYHISKDILDEIRDTADPAKIAEKVFAFIESDLPYWDRNGPFPLPIRADRFNKGFSNPAFHKIQAYFGRFGYSNYERDLARKLGAEYAPTKNMVDQLVVTRNKIAHGDPAATMPPSDVKAMMRLIKVYCRSTDDVFASWCGTSLCRIR